MDLAVMGGGINGLCTAWGLALRKPVNTITSAMSPDPGPNTCLPTPLPTK